MNSENPALAETTSLDEELVSYLDGELSPDAAKQVERRLAEDPSYRARLTQLQRAWDLLDSLQRLSSALQTQGAGAAQLASAGNRSKPPCLRQKPLESGRI